MAERCEHCGKEHKPSVGAICGGVGKRYVARVRWYGYWHYKVLGKPTKSYKVALRRMTEAFSTGNYKRGDVLMEADYYDPIRLCELVSRG